MGVRRAAFLAEEWMEFKHQLIAQVHFSFFFFGFDSLLLIFITSLIVTGNAESASEPYSELR